MRLTVQVANQVQEYYFGPRPNSKEQSAFSVTSTERVNNFDVNSLMLRQWPPYSLSLLRTQVGNDVIGLNTAWSNHL